MKSEVPRFGNKFENTLSAKRYCQDVYEIVNFLHKSLITEKPSIKDKMKLSMENFDSEALIKQQKIFSFKIPLPPPSPTSPPKLPSNAPSEYDFFTEGCFYAIKECCRIWQSHLIALLLLLGYFACKHVSTMRNFSF